MPKKYFVEQTLFFFSLFPKQYQTYIKKKQGPFRNHPVIIYSNGKSGTSSLHKSLVEQGVSPCLHCHHLLPENVKKSVKFPKNGPKAIASAFVLPYDSVDIITLIINPLERFISGFFHAYFKTKRSPAETKTNNLIFELEKMYYEKGSADWFNVELKPFTGFDIYQTDFQPHKGFSVNNYNKYKILALKIEQEDYLKEEQIKSFLNINKFKFKKLGHVGNKSNYSKIYSRFKNECSLPEEMVNELTTNSFSSFFYSNTEIKHIRNKWIKATY